tara:strand:+ start:151 stop:411 length:261 start_codon:yes stop_codon:yes gene_type:complete
VLIAGASGVVTLILKSDIVGAAPRLIDGLEYVGAEEVTLIAPASKLGDDIVVGRTEEIDKSDIEGALERERTGIAYVGAVPVIVTL